MAAVEPRMPVVPMARYDWERRLSELSGPLWREGRRRQAILSVARALAMHADADGSNVFPGVVELGRQAGVGKNAAYLRLEDCRVLGIVTMEEKGERRRNKSDRHRLTWPCDPEAAMGALLARIADERADDARKKAERAAKRARLNIPSEREDGFQPKQPQPRRNGRFIFPFDVSDGQSEQAEGGYPQSPGEDVSQRENESDTPERPSSRSTEPSSRSTDVHLPVRRGSTNVTTYQLQDQQHTGEGGSLNDAKHNARDPHRNALTPLDDPETDDLTAGGTAASLALGAADPDDGPCEHCGWPPTTPIGHRLVDEPTAERPNGKAPCRACVPEADLRAWWRTRQRGIDRNERDPALVGWAS